MGRAITAETVAFGVGGQLHRDDDFPDLPAKARVHLDLYADFASVKHKFLEKGGVEEILILTIDTSTVKVLDVEEVPEQQELPAAEGEKVVPIK
jgi:hypothetical protein